MALLVVAALSVHAALLQAPQYSRSSTRPAMSAEPQQFFARLPSVFLATTLAGVITVAGTPAALAVPGSVTQLPLEITKYEETECPEELAQGRAGGALGAGAGGAGIAQKCVLVKAKASNPSSKTLEDAGVFGRVSGKTDGMSVLGNGQDGKNDAGQFAMIPKIPPGDSEIDFLFVAQQATDCRSTRKEKCPVQGTEPLNPLVFEKVKAIAYPNGKQFKVYDECEQNEFAEGCQDE